MKRTISIRTPRPSAQTLFHEGQCPCERCRFEVRFAFGCLGFGSVALGFIWAVFVLWR